MLENFNILYGAQSGAVGVVAISQLAAVDAEVNDQESTIDILVDTQGVVADVKKNALLTPRGSFLQSPYIRFILLKTY